MCGRERKGYEVGGGGGGGGGLEAKRMGGKVWEWIEWAAK